METRTRRETLKTIDNPDVRMDYVTTLDGSLPWPLGGAAHITIRYVPDRVILTPDALAAYLSALAATGWTTPEALATTVLDDLNNELVARWTQVIVTAPVPGKPGVDGHAVMLEDRQPKWENDALLSRLRHV